MDDSCSSSSKFDSEWNFEVLVVSSVALQILVFVVAPLRRWTKRRSVQGLISIIFSVSNWIPAITLILISSFAVFSYDRGTSYSESPLLTWASLMLLQLAGHGQERETPLPLELGEITREYYRVILDFLFYGMVFYNAFFFQPDPWNDKTTPITFGFILLACLKTFGKLKHLRDRCDEIKQKSSTTTIQSHPSNIDLYHELDRKGVTLCATYLFKSSWELILGRSINPENTTEFNYLKLHPRSACNVVEAELKLIYNKCYGGVIPSVLELVIASALLAVDFSSPLITFTTRIIYEYAIPISSCLCMLVIITRIEAFLLQDTGPSIALLPVLPYIYLVPTFVIYELPISKILSHILVVTHHLIACPWALHYFHLHDPSQWLESSRNILRFNMLTYSFWKPSKMSTSIHYILNTWSLSGKEQYEDDMKVFIFNGLKNMLFCQPDAPSSSQAVAPSRKAAKGGLKDMPLFSQSEAPSHTLNVTRHIKAAKGVWVLKQYNHQDLVDYKAPFEERVLLWHVATGILYHTGGNLTRKFHQSTFMSMLLSDYMGYLLIVQPWIMSKQRGAVLRTCLEMWAEINELTKDNDIILQGYPNQERELKIIFQNILKQRMSNETDQTKTMLNDACLLVKKLESKFPKAIERWNFIVKVWIEKLAYAAARCNPIDHIQGLSQGGELASTVWLWMLHFESMSKPLSSRELHEIESMFL